jgi:two-component system sensor histidine kinase MprB
MISKVRHLSFRARLGTFIAAAVGVTVALACLAAYFTVKHQLFSQVDSSLVGYVNRGLGVSPDGTMNIPEIARIVRSTDNGFVQVITDQGSVTDSSFDQVDPSIDPPQPTQAQDAVAQSNGGYRLDTIRYDGTPYRVITQKAQLVGFPGPISSGPALALQIGWPVGDIYKTLSTLRLILWLVTFGGIAAALGLAFVIAKTTLRPVRKLTAAAEHVAATQDLSATIDEDGDDELARLARSFNAMLMALAASRRQQAQLISDAGHELRTPLTSLRTNIELLLKRPDLPQVDREELIRDVEAQLEELTTLIGDVVDLARQEETQPEAIEVRLDDIARRAVERARRRAPGLVFETHLTAGSVKAQPALLERAILNVLDNATKWSPPEGIVEVWLQRGAYWTLDVHDHGPGIAAEDLPYVFDRFYRAASARALPGSGLGLAIVRQVIEDHGGSVSASVPPEGGTLVHIELPIVSEAEPDAAVELPTYEPSPSF